MQYIYCLLSEMDLFSQSFIHILCFTLSKINFIDILQVNIISLLIFKSYFCIDIATPLLYSAFLFCLFHKQFWLTLFSLIKHSGKVKTITENQSVLGFFTKLFRLLKISILSSIWFCQVDFFHLLFEHAYMENVCLAKRSPIPYLNRCLQCSAKYAQLFISLGMGFSPLKVP